MTTPRPSQSPSRNPAAVFRTLNARRGLTPAAATSPVLMGVDVERPYACEGCGARVMLCAAEPLPVGWRAVGVGRGTRYLCPVCRGEILPIDK